MKTKKKPSNSGRPKESVVHRLEINDWAEVPFSEMESTKQIAYRENAKGEKIFRFFTSGGRKFVERRQ